MIALLTLRANTFKFIQVYTHIYTNKHIFIQIRWVFTQIKWYYFSNISKKTKKNCVIAYTQDIVNDAV